MGTPLSMPGCSQLAPGWFRLLLAFVVVLYHTRRIVFIGYWAVFVFFVLSGYWLHEMYRDKFSRAVRPITTFYASRILRVYPVFAVATLLAIVVRATVLALEACEFSSSWQQWMPLGYSAFSH